MSKDWLDHKTLTRISLRSDSLGVRVSSRDEGYTAKLFLELAQMSLLAGYARNEELK